MAFPNFIGWSIGIKKKLQKQKQNQKEIRSNLTKNNFKLQKWSSGSGVQKEGGCGGGGGGGRNK